tara:strand:- start:9282 stop:10379 length:1098 start_codon:yes stop_codon:yes gene_type:complete
MIPIYKPMLDNYKKSALDAIKSNWISNYGIYVKNCEQILTSKLGVKHCILMNNGTAATHCLFLAIKFKYPQITKIYVPNCVFIAAWNCPLMEYDYSQLEVLKLNPQTYNIDITKDYIDTLESGSAVIIVHNLGNIVNVPKLKKMRPDIIFVEDNCEGFTGKYNDEYSGMSHHSLCSSVSFYGNKSVTTGEGGAFFTNHTDVYEYVKSIYSHGMTDKRYIHNKLAYNYRMTNIQAAFLYDQVNDLSNIIKMKENVFKIYDEFLEELFDEGKLIKISKDKTTKSACWMYSFFVPKLNYDDMEHFMNTNLIQIRPFFYDISFHPHLQTIKKHDSEVFQIPGIMIPSFPEITIQEQKHICIQIKDYLSR